MKAYFVVQVYKFDFALHETLDITRNVCYNIGTGLRKNPEKNKTGSIE